MTRKSGHRVVYTPGILEGSSLSIGDVDLYVNKRQIIDCKVGTKIAIPEIPLYTGLPSSGLPTGDETYTQRFREQWPGGTRNRGSIHRKEERNCYFLQSHQTGSGVHAVSCTILTQGSFNGCKVADVVTAL
jgi:hypothetical protein